MSAVTLGPDSTTQPAAYHKHTWYERGRFLMGTTDTIEWSYEGNSIADSSAYQSHRFVFPNIAAERTSVASLVKGCNDHC